MSKIKKDLDIIKLTMNLKKIATVLILYMFRHQSLAVIISKYSALNWK